MIVNAEEFGQMAMTENFRIFDISVVVRGSISSRICMVLWRNYPF